MREVNYIPTLAAGNLVNIEVDFERRQDLEFVTCGCDQKSITLWEKIDLYSFPSCNDFSGARTTVPMGTIAIVVGVAGVPHWVTTYLSLREKEAPPEHRLIRNDLTVYDILVEGRQFQAFGCDMKLKRDL